MKINDRLKKIGDLVDDASFCLDVGCDHALLSIYLVKKGKNIRVIASDVALGPVLIAEKNIRREHLEDKIKVALADGLDSYSEGVDTIIISGMGGRNMIGIFKRNLSILKKVKTILLSPNNYQKDVKKFLCKHGFYIEDEEFVKDKKFIYQIIKFSKGKKKYWQKDYFFGPVFLKKKDMLFYEYYLRELKSREVLLELLPKNYRLKRLLIKREIHLIKRELS